MSNERFHWSIVPVVMISDYCSISSLASGIVRFFGLWFTPGVYCWHGPSLPFMVDIQHGLCWYDLGCPLCLAPTLTDRTISIKHNNHLELRGSSAGGKPYDEPSTVNLAHDLQRKPFQTPLGKTKNVRTSLG